MSQQIRRQFLAKNQIHLRKQQQVVDRGHQQQAIMVAEPIPLHKDAWRLMNNGSS
jgi:hypothetical protein